MNARWMVGVLCLWCAMKAHAAFDLDMLMTQLSEHPGGRVDFVEKRYAALLDKPVISKGEMTYVPTDRLEKRTIEPKAETMILDGDALTLERGQRKLSLQISSRPEIRAFVDSIRSTISGNRQAIEKNYAMQLSGQLEDWKLVLWPTDPKIGAFLKRMTVSGNGRQIREIEYLQADDDRTVIYLKSMAQP